MKITRCPNDSESALSLSITEHSMTVENLKPPRTYRWRERQSKTNHHMVDSLLIYCELPRLKKIQEDSAQTPSLMENNIRQSGDIWIKRDQQISSSMKERRQLYLVSDLVQ